jgi:hypothetical protein
MWIILVIDIFFQKEDEKALILGAFVVIIRVLKR